MLTREQREDITTLLDQMASFIAELRRRYGTDGTGPSSSKRPAPSNGNGTAMEAFKRGYPDRRVSSRPSAAVETFKEAYKRG